MTITNKIRYLGVNDRTIDLFEGQYTVPNGMAYHSYAILDEKIAILDTVDQAWGEQWMANISAVLAGRTPDYLVVHHMEPDHSANIHRFLTAYPQAVVVASAKAFTMMQQFFGTDYAQRRMVVGQSDTLSLGKHTLTFYTAPMVHWPEVLVSYDDRDKTLFSADAFGKFGALDAQEDWACEARRYYFGIVGKYGPQVQSLLKKLSGLELERICPLHGPILTPPLDEYLRLYQIWSSYQPEDSGVVIAYTSVYGNTRSAAQLLAQLLEARGIKVVLHDLARCDLAEAVEDAFRYDRLVLATTTYNGEIFPFMQEFIHHLTQRNYQNRTVAFIENGSWAPVATRVMKQMLESAKNLTFADNEVRILSALSSQSTAQLEALATELSGQPELGA